MGRTAELRGDLITAALDYTAHVLENAYLGNHASRTGKALGAAAKAYREALDSDEQAPKQ